MSFTPKAFLERLRGSGFSSLSGVIKPPDTGSDLLLFSFKPCPAWWIPIPLDVIENIDWLSTVTCKDGEYQSVRILLKTSQTPEGRILAALLATRTSSNRTPPPPAALRRRKPSFGGSPRGSAAMMKAAPTSDWGSCMDKCLYEFWPDWDEIVRCQTWVCGDETLPPDIEL